MASILAAGGRRLGPEAMVLDMGRSVRLPHREVQVEAVVAAAGLLGREGRAEIACVARGAPGPSFTVGMRPQGEAD